MMIVMAIMYLITSLASGFAKEQALGGLNRVYGKWVQLERYETQLVKAYEETTAVVQEQAATVARLYLEGKPEESAMANNGATQNLQAMGRQKLLLWKS